MYGKGHRSISTVGDIYAENYRILYVWNLPCRVQRQPGFNVSGLAAFGPPAQEDADPFPLRWGEVIPLHFILSHTPLTKVQLTVSNMM